MKHMNRIFPILICLLLCTISAAARPYGSVQNQRYDGYEIRRGIDVSEHNGSIDWSAAAASREADFAFIRVGYRGYSSGGLYPDSRYRENLNGALATGIDVGVYIYSQATSITEAREEAEYVLDLLRDYAGRLTLPVVMDLEYAEDGYTGRLYDAHRSVTEQTEICNAFCDVIRRAGLTPCVYANQTMLTEHLNVHALTCDIWLANHADETGYNGDYTFWQYTADGSVRGLSGEVDCNYWYYAPPSSGSVRAQQITLRNDALTLEAGQSAALTATIYPSYSVDTLRFYSDDPTIAYVDKISGEVTGVRAGQTQIRVQTGNGLSAVCTVTVSGTQTGTYGFRIASVSDALFTGSDTTTRVVVQTDETSGIGAAATVTADLLNLRAWPYRDYTPIATLKKGERVTVLGSVVTDGTKWMAVRCESNGTLGYVSPDYLELKSGKVTLTEGIDYVLYYSDNQAPGYGTVTAEGIGAFAGTDSRQFRIFTYDDVKETDWYFDAVWFAVRSGLMQGTSGRTFSPNVSTSRAMMVTILYRLNGSPFYGKNHFSDVALTDWYGPAAVWASENGVDHGVGDLFNPNGMLTRAQMAVMLFQNTKQMGYETPVDRSVTDGYTDWLQVPESAREAVRWAVGAGIITGMGNDTLSPNTGATRAQICTVMERYEALLQQQDNAPLLFVD